MNDSKKARAEALLEKGVDTKKIANRLGIRQIQVMGLKAARTRRMKKKGCKTVPSNVTLAPANPDHKTVVKMIKRGQSTKEVVQALRKKYSPAQIMAVRAHITMGTY